MNDFSKQMQKKFRLDEFCSEGLAESNPCFFCAIDEMNFSKKSNKTSLNAYIAHSYFYHFFKSIDC